MNACRSSDCERKAVIGVETEFSDDGVLRHIIYPDVEKAPDSDSIITYCLVHGVSVAAMLAAMENILGVNIEIEENTWTEVVNDRAPLL